jgi:hypothetical protein
MLAASAFKSRGFRERFAMSRIVVRSAAALKLTHYPKTRTLDPAKPSEKGQTPF